MQRRTLIRTLKLPDGSDARALAECLSEDFSVASISGSKGEHEVQFVSPDELVVVVSSSRVRFFYEPRAEEEDDEDDEDDDDAEDPYEIAEEIGNYLAYRVGKRRLEEEVEEPKEEVVTDDDADRIARLVMTRLLDEELLELVTLRSRHSVEKHLAHCIAHGQTGARMCDDLADLQGVAELYATDEQLDEILAACRRKPANPLAVLARAKPVAKPTTKAPVLERTKSRADAPKPRKSKM